jgi:hypothetical protein
VTGRNTQLKTSPLGLHYVAALIVAGAYFAVTKIARHPELLASVGKETRSALYISLTTTCGALLGFGITAVTILLALGGGRRVEWLYRDERFAYARKIFLGGIRVLAIATLYFSMLIVADTATRGKTVWETIAAFFVILVILRVARIVRLLGDLLHIAIADRGDSGHENPPFKRSINEPDE